MSHPIAKWLSLFPPAPEHLRPSDEANKPLDWRHIGGKLAVAAIPKTEDVIAYHPYHTEWRDLIARPLGKSACIFDTDLWINEEWLPGVECVFSESHVYYNPNRRYNPLCVALYDTATCNNLYLAFFYPDRGQGPDNFTCLINKGRLDPFDAERVA